MKIVINKCYGGFGLSPLARKKYHELGGGVLKDYEYPERSDPLLVKVVEELGESANGGFAELKVVEIPDDVDFTIEEYDGVEWVSETHRTWG